MTQSKFDKTAKQSAYTGQENLDALINSGTILAKGCEDFFKTYAALTQQSLEKNTQAVKTLLGCKTPTEWVDAHNKIVQENFEDAVSGFNQLSEISIRVATAAFEPIGNQAARATSAASETARAA